ncbi:MAG: toll/interleukin-1 receptor domain-containing protein [bacterium]|nr:toll/interleukin-1 receptor domain-containing protein [bacterium]
MKPVHQRDFHLFLSHASADKSVVVEKLFHWLTESAGLRVWYDADAIAGGSAFGSVLPQAIEQCRALVLMLSKASLHSAWVQQEYQYALVHQSQYPDFRIIPVLLEEVQPPGFMANVNNLKFPNADFDLDAADRLLKALSNFNPSLQAKLKYGRVRDIYVSRTWRDSESALADAVSLVFADADFRLIGDSRDQNIESKTRITTIMQSCGGLLAILPHRAEEASKTSPYIIDELHWAADMGIPYAVICEADGVLLPDKLQAGAAFKAILPSGASPDEVTALARKAAYALSDAWREPTHKQYVFFATDFHSEHKKRNATVRGLIERVTAMPCVIGDEIERTGSTSVQQVIVNLIKGAQLVVADITDDNLNTIYEAGIARGAGVQTVLISGSARQPPPFMLTDQQVFYYGDDVEMLGRVNKLIYPYRRRVLNHYLSQK